MRKITKVIIATGVIAGAAVAVKKIMDTPKNRDRMGVCTSFMKDNCNTVAKAIEGLGDWDLDNINQALPSFVEFVGDNFALNYKNAKNSMDALNIKYGDSGESRIFGEFDVEVDTNTFQSEDCGADVSEESVEGFTNETTNSMTSSEIEDILFGKK